MNLAKTPYSTDSWLKPLKSESRYPDWDEAFEMASMQRLLNSIVRPIRSVILFRVARAEAIAQEQFIHGFPFQPLSPISLLRVNSSSLASFPSSPSIDETLPLDSGAPSARSIGAQEAEPSPGLSSVIEYVEMDKDGIESERTPKRGRKSSKPSRKKSVEEPPKSSKGKGKASRQSKKATAQPVELSDDLATIPEKPRSGSNQGRNSEVYQELKTINGYGPYVYERQYIDGVYKSRYKGKEGKGAKQRQRDNSPKPTCPDCGSDKTVSNGTDKQRGKRCYKCTYCLHRWRVPLTEGE